MQKNSLSDLLPESNKLNGFYRGVVEDNNDPKKAGRVRIRIFGLHTEQKNKTDTEGIAYYRGIYKRFWNVGSSITGISCNDFL